MARITCRVSLSHPQASCITLFSVPFTYQKTGGQFPIPARSDTPLLAFRCTQAIRPYLPGDEIEGLPSVILIDTPIVYSCIDNASPIYNTDPTSASVSAVDVKVFINGHLLASGSVPLNVTKHELPFSLSDLQPRSKPYQISCIASTHYESQTFSASGLLTYLPDPPSEIGSVTRMDLRTGALLARPADGKGGPYSPVFPSVSSRLSVTILARICRFPQSLHLKGNCCPVCLFTY